MRDRLTSGAESHPVATTAARGLVLGGALAVAVWTLWTAAPALVRPNEARRFFGALPVSARSLGGQAEAVPSPAIRARAWSSSTGRVGWLDIPRLGVSAPVRAGTSRVDLLAAVGHVPGTAFPGEAGNAVMAAHRDGYFHALAGIEAGDSVVVTTLDGKFLYRVDSIDIVAPERVDVLAPTRGGELTLLTCYPFRHVGPAPDRFVVRSQLVRNGSRRW